MTKKTDSYGFVCKWIVKILIALACILIFTWNNNTLKVNAEETTYAHSDTATDASGNVVLKVEWNEPVLGQPLTFHVSATGEAEHISLIWKHQATQIQMKILMSRLQILVGENGRSTQMNVAHRIIHSL